MKTRSNQTPADVRTMQHALFLIAAFALSVLAGCGTSATPSTATAKPVITWAAPASVVYGTALTSTQLDATANVPGTFVYSPAAGVVPAAGTDTLSVSFTPLDTTDYTTATATAPLVVTQAIPTISWPRPAGISFGTPLSAVQLDASSFTPGTFVYTPAAGTVEPVGTDTLSVVFTPTDSVDDATVTTTTTITVTNPITTTTLTWPTPAGVVYGTALGGAQLDATASAPGTITYAPAAGAIEPAGTDTLTATFTPTDPVHYSTATAQVQLAVSKATPQLAWPAPAAIPYGTALGAAQLDATSTVPGSFGYTPAAGTVLTAGNDPLAATFTPTDTNDYNTGTTAQTLKVTQVIPVITWATPAPVSVGTMLSAAQLNASANVPGTLAYTPGLGATPPAGNDTLTVTLTPTDAVDYTTATATVVLKVVTPTAPTVIWPAPAAITYGTALSAAQLNATASVAGTFAYTPVAGTVLPAGTTNLSVTFTPTDTLDYSSVTQTVPLVVNKATPALTWPTPVPISTGTPLGSIQLDATASVPGTFVYTPPLGTVEPQGNNTLAVTFTATDTTDYTTAQATVVLQVVNKATPTLTWPVPASIVYGTALSGAQLDATASVAGTFAYTPAAGTIVPAGTDTLSVTFTPTDTADYTGVTQIVKLVVSKATPIVTWATPAGITYGTALGAAQLNATASVAGTFTYAPAAGTTPPAGTDTLSVTFTPTDATDYNTATATVSLVVGKATPAITWPSPASITYGTLLSATQLDATASTPGAFVYSPAAGALEPSGNDTLSVTFTPTDTTDYTVATATTQLTVTRATPVITWAMPASINSSTPLSATQLDATANVAGAFAYTPAAGATLPVGTDTLSTTFTPTDTTDYTTATDTVLLVVTSSQKVPTVTWATPAAIPQGYALSATQLNATASVPGTFLYTPAPGTIEPAGTNTLQVTFTPTDTTDYSNVTTSVQLVVTPAPASLNTLAFIQQMVNLDSLAEFPSGAGSGEEDSKDTRAYGTGATYFYGDIDGGNFHGDVTLGGVTQHIMLTATGPGVVTRLFTGGPGFAGHNIRYYIDGSQTPAIQADLNSLLSCQTPYAQAPLCYESGEPYPFPVLPQGAPSGQDLYLPVPFAKSIMVTYDGPANTQPVSPGSNQPYPVLDYVFEYKLLPSGTNVTSYSLTDYQNNQTAIQAALAMLPPIGQTGVSAAPGPYADSLATQIFNQSIPAGGSAVVTLPGGPNAIRYLQSNIGSSAATLAGVTISITFDGEQTVAAVPFGDFFGAGNGTQFGGGTGASSNIGLNAGTTMSQSVTSDGKLVSRWTMPYKTSASITIDNNTAAAVTVPLIADVNTYAFDSDTMHFHAREHVTGSTTTTNNQTTRLLWVNGSGVYVGDNTTYYTYQNAGDTNFNFWGEGDEMFYIDSDVPGFAYPSHRGTGTEDYYGYAYGNPAIFQVPWASNVADAPQTANEGAGIYNGTTVLNRTRLLDTIPFNTHLRFDFEIDDHDQSTTGNDGVQADGQNHLVIDHVAFFYALPGVTYTPDGLVSGQNYTLQSKIAGWHLDSTGGTMHTQIMALDPNQVFTLTQNAQGLWTIKDVVSGMYVGVAGNSSSAGLPLTLGAATGGCGQLWSISDSGLNNDYEVISNSCDGQVMDLYYALQVPGTTVQQYYQNGTDAQYWRFNLVPAN